MKDITSWSFADDANKVHDFLTLSMEEFMFSYSYLDEKDYFATYNEIMEMLKERYPYFEMEEV